MTDVTMSYNQPSPEAVKARAVLLGRSRWGVAEIAFWVIAAACYFLLPTKLSLLSEIAILGLLALSIDLVLGYAGIVTLGQGAFFGIGAYAAGLAAKYGAGSAPWSLMMSMVAMARPAPLTMKPISPSSAM